MIRKFFFLVFASWTLTSCYTKHRFTIKNTNGTLDSISGVLTSEKSIKVTADTVVLSETAYAFFRNKITDSFYTNIGNVMVNNDTLLFSQDHYERLVDGMDTAANWKVNTSLSNLPSFNYSFVNPYPSYYIVPPDTIHISKGFSFPCMFVNADSVELFLGFDTLGKVFHKILKPTDTTLAFTKSQIATLNPSGAVLSFTLHKFTTKTYNYRHFAFFKTYKINYSKTVFVP